MSVNELFVKRVPVFADEDVVNNHFGLVLKEVIQRLGLGRFHWSLFPQKKSRCLISTQPGDVDRYNWTTCIRRRRISVYNGKTDS